VAETARRRGTVPGPISSCPGANPSPFCVVDGRRPGCFPGVLGDFDFRRKRLVPLRLPSTCGVLHPPGGFRGAQGARGPPVRRPRQDRALATGGRTRYPRAPFRPTSGSVGGGPAARRGRPQVSFATLSGEPEPLASCAAGPRSLAPAGQKKPRRRRHEPHAEVRSQVRQGPSTRSSVPATRSRSTWRVIEGDKERAQMFQGVGREPSAAAGTNATFTVRKVSDGIGVERIFPIHSPSISKIVVARRGPGSGARSCSNLRKKDRQGPRRSPKRRRAETTAQ